VHAAGKLLVDLQDLPLLAVLPVGGLRAGVFQRLRSKTGFGGVLKLAPNQEDEAAEVAADGRTPGSYFVARLAVSALKDLNLTVIPTPGDLPGHAVILELNRALYLRDKQRSKKLQFQLAQLASQAIVYRPAVS